MVRTALVVVVLAAGLVVGASGGARAERDDARKHYDRATAAFGLGRYADAAKEYEAAFALRPDPALLYNSAQAYRLAGNKQRALELYRNYVRLYGGAPNAEDARKHVADLDLQAAAEAAVPPAAENPVPAPTPGSPSTAAVGPVAPAPAVTAPAPVSAAVPAAPPMLAVATPPPAPTTPGADLASGPGSAGATHEGSLLSRPWFWVAVGAVVVGGVVGVLLLTRKTEDPKPSFGVVVGN